MDGAPSALLPLPGGSWLVIVRFDDRQGSLMASMSLRLNPIGDHLGRRRGQRVVEVLSATFSANGIGGGLREATVLCPVHLCCSCSLGEKKKRPGRAAFERVGLYQQPL
ncbi:hypothetical protein ACVWZK_004127 [Bradyrhizobium sp. GM0.4]